jgi:hypothetical protein
VADPSVQPPEGLRKILIEKFMAREHYRTEKDTPECPNCGEGCAGHEEETYHYTCGEVVPCSCATDAVDAVLAALFDACEVREQWGVQAGPRGNRFWGYATRSEALVDVAEGLADGHTDWLLIHRCDLKTPAEPVSECLSAKDSEE